uniref:Uncharacterized protein n=1 Tax=Romanomermis culicivorax TaxID=13658 RepID=A0A915JU95_ROMCU
MRLHTDLIASSHWAAAAEDFRSIRSDVMKVYFATFFYCILTAQLWRAADFVSVAEIIASKVADAAKDLLQGKKEIVKTAADDM